MQWRHDVTLRTLGDRWRERQAGAWGRRRCRPPDRGSILRTARSPNKPLSCRPIGPNRRHFGPCQIKPIRVASAASPGCVAAPGRGLAPVAQLDRAPDYESGGWEFESLRARQSFQCRRCRIGPISQLIFRMGCRSGCQVFCACAKTPNGCFDWVSGSCFTTRISPDGHRHLVVDRRAERVGRRGDDGEAAHVWPFAGSRQRSHSPTKANDVPSVITVRAPAPDPLRSWRSCPHHDDLVGADFLGELRHRVDALVIVCGQRIPLK